MEEELLKELDSILCPAIDSAWRSANRHSIGNDPRNAFLDYFKVEIDNTKVDLSNKLQKIDIAIQPRAKSFVDSIVSEPDIDFPSDVNELPEVNTRDYIRKIADGFEVWDGSKWHKVSPRANMKLEVFQNPENNNRPAAKLWVLDEETKTSVIYIDNDIIAQGWDLSLTEIGDGYDQFDETIFEERFWQDPSFELVKRGLGGAGRSSGMLAMRQMGNFTPWFKGDNLKYADGWYRNKKGIYEQLSKQRGRGAGGYQGSAKRAASKAKMFQRAGRICFWVSATISTYDAGNAYYQNDANKEEVALKASLDITMGAIGVFGGPVGWVISGAYFLSQLSGDWGDFGKPTGMTHAELDTFNQRRYTPFRQNLGQTPVSLDFEVDYCPSSEPEKIDFEERFKKRDNTQVVQPNVLFSKD